MVKETVVETDSRSRVVLPGHRNERFIMEELEDGVIRLVPAAVISEAQLEYLTTPELRSLLTDAAAAPTVTRGRRERRPRVTGKKSPEGPQYSYSRIADEQLNALEQAPDARLSNALVDTCENILDDPSLARERSAVIATDDGLRFRTPVAGAFPYKVFWSMTDGVARIEAVFPYDA